MENQRDKWNLKENVKIEQHIYESMRAGQKKETLVIIRDRNNGFVQFHTHPPYICVCMFRERDTQSSSRGRKVDK